MELVDSGVISFFRKSGDGKIWKARRCQFEESQRRGCDEREAGRRTRRNGVNRVDENEILRLKTDIHNHKVKGHAVCARWEFPTTSLDKNSAGKARGKKKKCQTYLKHIPNIFTIYWAHIWSRAHIFIVSVPYKNIEFVACWSVIRHYWLRICLQGANIHYDAF